MQHIDIHHLAQLARLDLTEEEKAEFEKSMPAIIDYIGQLQEIDTSHVDTKAYITDEVNVMREDAVKPSKDRQAVIDAFPASTNNALEVPAVFE